MAHTTGIIILVVAAFAAIALFPALLDGLGRLWWGDD